MDRWHRLEDAIVEIEQFARNEEREKWSKHVVVLEAKLSQATKRFDEANAKMHIQREVASRLEQEIIALRAHNHLLQQTCMAFKLLEQRDDILQSCRDGDVHLLLKLFDAHDFNNNTHRLNEMQELKDEALRICASEGFLDLCELLLVNGADPVAREKENGQNALHRAVSALGHSDSVLHLLVQNASNQCNVRERINDIDFNGQTPLSLAVRLLRVDRVLCLLSLGADTAMVSREDWKRLNDFQVRQEEEEQLSSGSVEGEDIAVCEHEAATIQPLPLGLSNGTSAADLLFQQGRVEEALEKFAVNPHTLLQAAKCCAMLNRHCEAIEFATRALEDPQVSQQAALLVRADSRFEIHDFQGALADFEEVGNGARAAVAREKLRKRKEDLYDVLGVSPTASSLEIRKAFLKQCLRWHPDKNRQTRDDEARAGFMFRAVNDAHLVLMDLKKRREYDNASLQTANRREEEEEMSTSSSFEDDDDDMSKFYYEDDEEEENQDKFFEFLQAKTRLNQQHNVG